MYRFIHYFSFVIRQSFAKIRDSVNNLINDDTNYIKVSCKVKFR